MTNPRHRAALLGATLALPLLLIACTDPDPGPGDGTPTAPGGDGPAPGQDLGSARPAGDVPPPADLDDAPGAAGLLEGSSALGAEVTAQVLTDPELDTAVVSPASLATALVMMAAGAEGATRTEIEDLLGAGTDELVEAIQAARAARSDLDTDPADIVLDPLPDHAILHTANQVVLREDVRPLDAWLDTVAHRLGAGIVATPSTDMQEVLDRWVDLHTAGLIEESGIQATDLTVLVVQDAVLVASAWLEGFSEELTEDADFTLRDGEVVQVPTMHAERAMPYAEVDGHGAVRLALLDGLALQVVLPAQDTAPEAIDAEAWDRIGDALAGSEEALVDLALPRTDVATSFGLADALTPLGVVELFGPAPDLSRMLDDGGYVVDQAVQQVRLQIGEEGVVAAAVTELAVAESAPMPPEREVDLDVDRPFAVRLVDDVTGWVLFHGVVGDPRS